MMAEKKPHKPRPLRKPHKMREEYVIPDDVKRRIVTDLAGFATTGEVRAMLKEEYELEISLKDIIRYDATKTYCCVGEQLRTLFHQTRKEYVEGVADLHIANQAFRLRRLMAMALKAEKLGNLKLAAELYEQAAKDHGGAYTNERRLSGQVDHRHRMTPAQARDKIAEYMAQLPTPAKKQAATKH